MIDAAGETVLRSGSAREAAAIHQSERALPLQCRDEESCCSGGHILPFQLCCSVFSMIFKFHPTIFYSLCCSQSRLCAHKAFRKKSGRNRFENQRFPLSVLTERHLQLGLRQHVLPRVCRKCERKAVPITARDQHGELRVKSTSNKSYSNLCSRATKWTISSLRISRCSSVHRREIPDWLSRIKRSKPSPLKSFPGPFLLQNVTFQNREMILNLHPFHYAIHPLLLSIDGSATIVAKYEILPIHIDDICACLDLFDRLLNFHRLSCHRQYVTYRTW